MNYGYARVSTEDQNPALQLAALKKAGCGIVFKDKVTGAHVNRPALTRCLKKLDTGDTLIVWKLDRLGRGLRDLIRMLDEFKLKGIKFRSLTEAIDTETPAGRAMWRMIGVLAELESDVMHPIARPDRHGNVNPICSGQPGAAGCRGAGGDPVPAGAIAKNNFEKAEIPGGSRG